MSIFGAEGACSLPLPISWQMTTLLVTSHESSISPQSGSIRIYRDACVALFISTCIVGKNWLSMLELYFIARSATSASVFRRIGPLASNASTLPLSPRTLSRTTSPVQTLHQALQPTSNGNGLQPQKTKKNDGFSTPWPLACACSTPPRLQSSESCAGEVPMQRGEDERSTSGIAFESGAPGRKLRTEQGRYER